MIDLYELSKEYLDLLDNKQNDQDAPDEGWMDEGDYERLAELEELNRELNGSLEYPETCRAQVVEDRPEAIADFAREWHESMGTEVPEGFRAHIDWESIGNEILADWTGFKFEGSEYYVYF
jgi:hypothetical protein